MKEAEMRTVADFIHRGLVAGEDEAGRLQVRGEVRDLCAQFPLPHV
jgi:glycine/serine hydroxymethyltransferase